MEKKMKYAYPVDLEQNHDGSWTATFPGLPGATDGTTKDEALQEATDLLVSALSFYVEDGKPIPVPATPAGRPVVYVPLLEAAKFALHTAMLEQGLTNRELGERLGVTEAIVRRLRDPLHESKISRVEVALRAVGVQAGIEVIPA